MISMSSEQFQRSLFRVGKVAHPVIYPSADAPAAIIGRRSTYRKGDATVIINTPTPDEGGVALPRGRYSLRNGFIEQLPRVELRSAAERATPSVAFHKTKQEFIVTGRPEEPAPLTRGTPGLSFSISDVEAFPSAIIRAQAILARDGRLLFFDSKASRPIHECRVTSGEPFTLEGIVVLSSFTRAILREAFYSSVTLTPTSPEAYLGSGVVYRELGVAFRVEGEGGEAHTIIQPGTLVAQPA